MSGERGSLREDLARTVRELSDTYEELTLLYRFSSILSGLDADEICLKIVDEAVASTDVRTAAVLLLDEDADELRTHSAVGGWDRSLVLKRDGNLLWQSLDRHKTIGIGDVEKSELRSLFPHLGTMLLCPMVGKKRTIGLVVVGDKANGEEFYSKDIKLISAIAQQAALFIENAILSREMENFLIGTIRSFVKALEASSMWTAGHTERVTEYALSIGREMGISPEQMERLKICSLLHDIGKIATPKEILNKESPLDPDEWTEISRHPSIGAEILQGLEKFGDIIDCIRYHHEHYDGTRSVYGLKGEDIPLNSRILAVADAFDAMTSDRPYRKKRNIAEVVSDIESCSGTQFDPAVVRAFRRWVDRKFLSPASSNDV